MVGAFDAIYARPDVGVCGVNIAYDLRGMARWLNRAAEVEALYRAGRVLDLGLLEVLLIIAGKGRVRASAKDTNTQSLITDGWTASASNRLKAGDVYACDFNYAASLEVERAFLLGNDQGLFALVGKPAQVAWVEEGARFAPPVDAADAADDLDFEML